MVMSFRAKDGVPLTGPVVNLAAAGAANAVAIFALSAAAQQIGTKSMILKRVHIRNNAVLANVWVQIGTGVAGAFVDLVTPVLSISGMDDVFDLPPVESFATITAFPTTLPAGSIDIQIEVEERG